MSERHSARVFAGILVIAVAACQAAPAKEPTTEEEEPKRDAATPPKKDAGTKDTKPTPDMVEDEPGVDMGGPDTAGPAADGGAKDGGSDGGGDGGAPAMKLIDDPTGPMPADLGGTGIFPAYPDMTKVDPRAFAFAPRYPLWSNGLEKTRFAIVPAGKKIVSTTHDAWDFPVGTLFVKSFHHKNPANPNKPVYIETRIIRRVSMEGGREEQWQFHVYEWNADNSAAKLIEIKKRTPHEVPANVTVDNNATKFTHNIPSVKDCWNCHLANKAPIIGFDELRLNWKIGTATQTLLEQVVQKQWLTTPPGPIAEITGRTPQEKAVLEYLQANCAHCHRKPREAEPGAGFEDLDLTYQKAVQQTVNQMTMSVGTATGIRVIPGDPMKSVLYRAMLAIDNPAADMEVKPMPTVGVDRADQQALKAVSDWITVVRP